MRHIVQLMKWRNGMKPSCPNEETLADYIEGRLDTAAARKIEQHLQVCDPCMEDFLTAGVVMRGGGDTSVRPAPPDVTRRALQTVEARTRGWLPVMKDKLANVTERVLSAADALKGLNLFDRPMFATVRSGSGTTVTRPSRTQIKVDNDTLQIDVKWTLHHTAVIKITSGKNESREIPIRVTVKRDDREIASQLLTGSYAVFDDLGAGRYDIEFVKNGLPLKSCSVEIKETPS